MFWFDFCTSQLHLVYVCLLSQSFIYVSRLIRISVFYSTFADWEVSLMSLGHPAYILAFSLALRGSSVTIRPPARPSALARRFSTVPFSFWSIFLRHPASKADLTVIEGFCPQFLPPLAQASSLLPLKVGSPPWGFIATMRPWFWNSGISDASLWPMWTFGIRILWIVVLDFFAFCAVTVFRRGLFL